MTNDCQQVGARHSCVRPRTLQRGSRNWQLKSSSTNRNPLGPLSCSAKSYAKSKEMRKCTGRQLMSWVMFGIEGKECKNYTCAFRNIWFIWLCLYFLTWKAHSKREVIARAHQTLNTFILSNGVARRNHRRKNVFDALRLRLRNEQAYFYINSLINRQVANT